MKNWTIDERAIENSIRFPIRGCIRFFQYFFKMKFKIRFCEIINNVVKLRCIVCASSIAFIYAFGWPLFDENRSVVDAAAKAIGMFGNTADLHKQSILSYLRFCRFLSRFPNWHVFITIVCKLMNPHSHVDWNTNDYLLLI